MSTTAPKPATTPIPVQLSATEFTAFILPHLTMPKRGPKCKLGYHRLFNLILWVLYTGMQWKCLPVPHDAHGKPAIHYTTVYRVFAKWADDGSLGRRSSPVCSILQSRNLSTPACCMATGPTRWPTKGGRDWVLRVQTPEGRESYRHHRQSWLCLSSCPRCARQCNGDGAPAQGATRLEAGSETGRVGLERRLPDLDGGFDSIANRKCIFGLDHGIGHFMLFEVDSEAQASAPPIPKSLQTSSAASDRKSALLPSSRQAE